MTLGEFVLDRAGESAAEALWLARNRRLTSMGEVEEYVETRLGSIIDALMPSAKEELATLTAPAAKQAVEAIKPAVYEALRDWTPAMASIVGLMSAMAVLMGVYVSKRVFLGRRRYS